jgi:hypothetical protein
MTAAPETDRGGRVVVRRVRARYLVAADHPDPARVRSTLDDAIGGPLADTLAMALAGIVSENNPAVWLIRRLDIDLDVNTGWGRDGVCRAVAAQVARALAAMFRDGPDGRDVMFFPDRAALLASFLADRTDGRADAWYYERFEGLRLLPVSAALRTSLCDPPALGFAALSRLGLATLRRVVSSLTPGDARRVLDALAESEESGTVADAAEIAWSAWQQTVVPAPDGDLERDTLRVYLAARAGGPSGGLSLRDAARAVIRLDQLLQSLSRSGRARLLGALTRLDRSALEKLAGRDDASALAPLLLARREWLREAVAAQAAGAAPAGAVRPGPRSTRFGGAFLLLPVLDAWPLDAMTEGWPDAGRVPAAAAARLLILAKALAGGRAAAATRDGLLRDLLGIDPALSAADLFAWQAGLSAQARGRFLEVLDAWHITRGAVTLETQFLVRGACGGRLVAVLLDAARGLWRRIATDPRGRPDRVVARLAPWLDQAPETGRFVCDPEFLAPLTERYGPARVASMAELGPDPGGDVREVAARRTHLPDDLDDLRPPPELGVAGALDDVLTVAAHALLRGFAWRLPGFGRAHVAHLRINVLDVPATLADHPDRRLVELGRPPLAVMLDLTGLSRDSYRLSWLDNRPIVLYPER